MKTPQEFLIEHGNRQYQKNKEDISPAVFDDPDLRFVIDAMIAFGIQEYNQGIDDAAENAEVIGGGFYGKSGDIDKELILKLKK